MNTYVRYAVAAAFAAASLASNVAHAVIEMESNDSISAAQPLAVTNGAVEVTGSVGVTSGSLQVTGDVDFYTFDATAGDVVQIDINGGMKDFAAGSRAVDTVIAVFGSDFSLLRQNDDADDVDLGSISTSDSRIVDFVVPATGKYVVGVSSFPRTFNEMGGGGLTTTSVDPNTGNGSYTLTVSGVTTPPPPVVTPPAEEPVPPVVTPPGLAQKINIDVRPRHSGVARIYPHADGRISVAVLSSASFDALKVDRASLTFGAEGDEASYVRCHGEGIDVNRDGRKDLVCRFDNRAAGFDVGDLEGVLKGTAEGRQIEGRAPLKIVMKGKKRKHQHEHHRHGHGRDDNRGHGNRDHDHRWHSNRGRD